MKSQSRSQPPARKAANGSLFCLASLVGILLLLRSSPALAGGVVTNCTEAALRAAMAGGGTVIFACDGTIGLASTITASVDLTLDASGHQVTISGNNAVQLFYVAGNVHLTLLNLGLANGWSTYGGGLYNAGGAVSATNCVFTGNRAIGLSGIGYGANGTNGGGGAVYNTGSFIASQCTFATNSAQGGSGANGNPGWPGNGASAQGGALCSVGAAFLDRCLFAYNSAFGGSGGGGSGGIYPAYATPGGSGGDGLGGAVYSGGTLTLVNCTLTGNWGRGGGGGPGGYQVGPWPPIRFGAHGGYSGDGVGAIYGSVILTNCTIASNFGQGGPGGSGGGSALFQGQGLPGGMAVGGVHGSALVINTILAANSGAGGSGGYGCWDASPVTCGYARNGDVATNLYGNVTDLGHNLGSDWSFTNRTSLNNTDPKLGPLADNGGPTLTMALLAGSPAIDAADSSVAPPTDQRGVPRPLGRSADIGAFEYNWPAALRLTRSSPVTVDVTIYGAASQSCRLLSSSNCSVWVPVATNQIGANGTVVFRDNCSSACRFYRLVMP